MCLGRVIRNFPIVTAILTLLVLSGYGLSHQWLGLSQPWFPHLGAGDVVHGPVCQWHGLLPRKWGTVSDSKSQLLLSGFCVSFSASMWYSGTEKRPGAAIIVLWMHWHSDSPTLGMSVECHWRLSAPNCSLFLWMLWSVLGAMSR